MKRQSYAKICLSVGFLLLVIHSFDSAQAFDVSAYYDPYSVVRVHTRKGGFNLGDCNSDAVIDENERNQWLGNIANNSEVLRWYEELGLTNLCVYYDDTLDYDRVLSGRSFQVMNDWMHTGIYRYVEARNNSFDLDNSYYWF